MGKKTFRASRRRPKGPGLAVLTCIFAVALVSPLSGQPAPADYLQLRAAYGVQSTFSTGALSLEELADLAEERDLDVIVLGDHHRIGFEYGFPPGLPLIRIRREEPSVSTHGVERYLEQIHRVNSTRDAVLLIPGVELLTHYYWSGNPFRGDLALHNVKMDMHVIGLERAEDYRRLPVIDGSFSIRYAARFLPYALGFAAMGIAGFLILRSARRLLLVGAGLLVVGLAGLVSYHPFRNAPYDAWRGDAGLAPYQEVIDYARERGAVVSWAAPEVNSRSRMVEKVSIMGTPPHPEVLLQTRGYTAFEGLYGDRREAHLPGGVWDQVLLEHCRGERVQPAWVVGSIDFHQSGAGPWMQLDGVQTVFLVRRRSQEEVLKAFRHGRMYAVFQGGASPIRLDYFQVRSVDGRVAVQGEELSAAGRLSISFRVSLENGGREPLKVQLIRSGRLLRELQLETPVEERFIDTMLPNSGKYYYRLIIESPRYEILTNPIFASY